jgi:hypothetical protein
MTTPNAVALVLLLAAPAFSASAPSPQRQLQERQIGERLALSASQQQDLRKERIALDEEEAAFRRRLGSDRDAFSRQERWNLKLFDDSLRGTPRLDAKQARRAFSDKQRLERKGFDANERQRRLQFYAEQRLKLKRLRALEAEQKRQLSIDQRGAREIQALR